MLKTLSTMSAAAGLVALLSSPADARQYETDRPRPDSSAPAPRTSDLDESKARPGADTKFIEQAAANGVAEVKLGELASQRASNGDVKEFAQKLVEDHSKANGELEKIAAAQNVSPRQELKGKHQKAYDKLSKLEGEAFDKAYVKHMVDDHQKAVKLFERQAKNASDPELKQFASSTLPKLQGHLAEAKRLQDEIGQRDVRGTTGTREADEPADRDRDRDPMPAAPEGQSPPMSDPRP